MKTTRWLVLLALTAFLSGCNFPGAPATPTMTVPPVAAATPTPAVSPTVEPPDSSSTPPGADLSDTALRNRSIEFPQDGISARLVDGEYQTAEGAAQPLRVSLLEPIARGDLNADGREDAAILVALNTGGSGVFVSLAAILDLNGQAVQTAPLYIDDRPRVEGLTIRDGEILFEGVLHRLDDAMVSPTLKVNQTFRLSDSGLALSSFSSGAPDGPLHSIQIDAPVSGSPVSGQTVQVRGSLPIAPFENNLRLRLLDVSGKELFAGPFGVQSADIGGPAVFDAAVDLSAVSGESRLVLELAELSMKDGSVVAMDSVVIARLP